jgi:hypothetical protein
MRRRWLVLVPTLLAVFILPWVAGARQTEDRSSGLTLLSNSPNPGTYNTDLAFWGNTAYAGTYDGLRILDISNPKQPVVKVDFSCSGSQGDVSVWGNLVFRSIDRPQTTDKCAGSFDTPGNSVGFEGIRIIDVSNPTNPQFVKGVAADCGSHTHTLLPDLANNRVLLYNSSFPSSPLGPTPYGTNCQRLKEGGGQGHSKISVIAVPLDRPDRARVISQPKFELKDFGGVPGHRGCHDIGVFMELKLAAAACLSEGQIWDISDPVNPVTLHRLNNPNIQIWHSGGFTWDGKVVIFGDEAGGGGEAWCKQGDPSTRGAAWFYDPQNPTNPLGHFKIPRPQTGTCTVHNYNQVVPISGRYIMISPWYSGGTSVADFTRPSRAREIAFYEAETPAANTWSSYWYNGEIYTGDIPRGLDILKIKVDRAKSSFEFPHMNPQTQENVIP